MHEAQTASVRSVRRPTQHDGAAPRAAHTDRIHDNTGMVAGGLESAMDALPDVVFFIKNVDSRYTHANMTLVRRLGLDRREELIGQRDEDLLPEALANLYAQQDERVLQGETIDSELQVQVLGDGSMGWCLTSKQPLRIDGEIRGLVGTSRDITDPDTGQPSLACLRRVYDYLREHYAEGMRVHTLAERAAVSVKQLEHHFRRVYQLTPQQMLVKLRIESAMRLLRGNDSVAAISHACGFADQSAFARQFKATVGMTPRDYRCAVATGGGMDN